jgi:hypothetical protein
MKYLIVAKWMGQKEIEHACIELNKGNWNYMLTNCTVIFEKLSEDLIKIELVK